MLDCGNTEHGFKIKLITLNYTSWKLMFKKSATLTDGVTRMHNLTLRRGNKGLDSTANLHR